MVNRPDPQQVIDLLHKAQSEGWAWTYNWCTAWDNSCWNVGDGFYINGLMMYLDLDFDGLLLVEVVEKEPGLVSWLVYAWGGLSGMSVTEWHPSQPQPFFDRSVDQFMLYRWAIDWYEQLDEETHVQ